MEVGSSDNPPPEPEGKRLTLGQCRLAPLNSLFWTLALVGSVFYLLTYKHLGRGGLFTLCAFAFVHLVGLFRSWAQYRRIRRGEAVYVAPQVSLLVPKALSVSVVSVLTLLVGTSDVIGAVIAYSNFDNPWGWTITGFIVLPFSLYTAYCWYRVVGEKRRMSEEMLGEQPEGVWPPAPRILTDK